MKKMSAVMFAAALIVTMSGCSTMNPWSKTDAEKAPSARVVNPVTVISSQPDWYVKSVDTPDAIFVTGTGYSQDMSMSMQKAMLDAQRNTAERINTAVSSFTKQYQADNRGISSEMTETVTHKLIAEIKVSGYLISNKTIVPEGGLYRTYVQIQYSSPEMMRLSGHTASAATMAKAHRDLDKRLDKKNDAEIASEDRINKM